MSSDLAAFLNGRIFENALDLLLITDRQGTFVRVSPSARTILGYEPDEMIGWSAEHFLHRDDLDHARAEMRAARRTRTPSSFECRHIHKDGRIVTLWWTATWSPSDERHYFSGRDVTMLKNAQAAETILRDGIETIPEGFSIYDAGERLVMCNAAYRAAFPGNSDYVAVGARYEDILRGVIAHGHVEVSPGEAEEWIAARLRDHRTAQAAIEQKLSDGRWVLSTKRPLSNGWVAGLRIDITALKMAQAALAASEQRFQDIAEVSADWIWETDCDHRFTVLTGERTTTLPVQPVGLFGRTRWEIANADPARDAHWGAHKADLDAHRPFRRFRYEMQTPTGSTMFLSASGKPVFDEDGEFIGYRGTATDETEVFTARRATEHAEVMLRNAIESVNEGFAIFDDEDRLVIANAAYQRLFPDNATPLTSGMSFTEISRRNVAGGLHPDALGREEEWIAERVRMHRDGHEAFEQEISDGRWLRVSTRRMTNGWTAGLRIDITQLKEAQEAALRVNRELSAIIASAPVAIFMLDPSGIVRLWKASAERVFGYTEAEALGRMPPYVPDDQLADFAAQRAQALATADDTGGFEGRRRHRDGRPMDVSFRWTRVKDDTGDTIGFMFAATDVTEQKKLESQLREAQRMEAIGQLTGGMAHDFNNLLGVIIANLDSLKADNVLNADQDELIGEAIDAALRGADLTRRLLAFARRQQLQPERIAVNELVTTVVALLARTLGEHIPITVDLADDLWTISADPAQLESALVNMATNARDAMPRGGQLSIATANRVLDEEYAATHSEVVAGDYVMIEITDTGSGIPAEVLDRVFEPFFTTKEPGRGTGLGLSMVFGFIKQSSGHVSVYSELGSGTTFRLYLPRHVGAPTSPAKSQMPPAIAGGGETILLVEDNDAIRRIVMRQLTQLGYRVLEAAAASAALQVLEAESVDLLFTDVVMPGGMDGVELAHIAMTRQPSLKVLLTSGFPDIRVGNGDLMAGLRLLTKPYRREELARSLRESLDHARNSE